MNEIYFNLLYESGKSKFFLQSLFHLWALIMEIISRSSAQRHVIKRRNEKNGKRKIEEMSRLIILKPTPSGEPQRSKQKDIKGRPKRKGKILREIFNYSQFIRVRFSSSSSSTPQSRYRPRRCRHAHGHTKKVGIFLRFHSFRLRWWWITQITRALFHASQGTWLSVRIWCWLCAMFRE